MKILPELEMEILSRLPVKSLLRFRCVSKEWLRILTVDNHFINNMHLPRSLAANSTNPNPSLISLSEYHVRGNSNCYIADYKVAEDEGGKRKGVVKPIYLDLPGSENTEFAPLDYYYRCVGVCNGLVCLTLYKFKGVRTVPFKLFVWNPLTRHHITLSCSSLPSLPEPDNRSFFGFGFHPPTNQYKVVRLLTSSNYPPNHPPHISVYTLGTETKTWRTIEVVPYRFGIHCYPITINGAPHWSVHKIESSSYCRLIVFFDVKDEVLREIPLPFPADDHSLHFTEFCGLLCIMTCSSLQNDIEIWVMKEHGVAQSWSKLLKTRELEIPEQIALWRWSPIGISLNGEVTFRSYYEEEEMKLLVYNPKTKSFEGPTKFGRILGYVFAFAGSLISPEVVNGGAQEVTITEEMLLA